MQILTFVSSFFLPSSCFLLNLLPNTYFPAFFRFLLTYFVLPFSLLSVFFLSYFFFLAFFSLLFPSLLRPLSYSLSSSSSYALQPLLFIFTQNFAMEAPNPHETPSWRFIGQGDLIQVKGRGSIHREAAVAFDAAMRQKKGKPIWDVALKRGDNAWHGRSTKCQVRVLVWFKLCLLPVPTMISATDKTKLHYFTYRMAGR